MAMNDSEVNPPDEPTVMSWSEVVSQSLDEFLLIEKKRQESIEREADWDNEGGAAS